ncbi:MAG TPA: gliding motility-associated C-terminal domain-containing protein [Bacteroidia bacterium]|jgi:gliding motility-associated-like protein|nr:gliding motility-associated C-terminal domain-containing protein [Bacteroidia bacterium]HMU19150.1 gliding motility-associated C-terminal domain-containing protein [Bacteroidia bacterium]
MKSIIALLIFTLLCSAGQATHIMGGELTFTLLGSMPQQQKKVYKISLNYYRNCDSSSAQFQPYYNLYICYDSSNTNYKRAYAQISLDKISTKPVIPPLLDSTCFYNNNQCVEKAYYEGTISLSEDTTWHLFLSDGTRNESINNLIQPDSTGIFFYTVIPAGISNSTPQFSNSPTPFICILDTVQINNLAFDSDGDSLAYKLVKPYGYIGSNNLMTYQDINLNLYYLFPLPTVIYIPGYSYTSPFGAGGLCNIDSQTGLLTIASPNQGLYVVAIEVEEYRNGTLLSRTRRDMQIVVVACSYNTAPQLISPVVLNYQIDEGDSICFPLIFTDAENNNINISATGNLFDAALTNPPALFVVNTAPNNNTAQFCWKTICGQATSLPYMFTVESTDNGCPSKKNTYVFSLYVKAIPHNQQPSIILNMFPDTAICTGTVIQFNASTQFAGNSPTYQWFINGQPLSNNYPYYTTNQLNNGDSISVHLISNSICVTDTTAISNTQYASMLQPTIASFVTNTVSTSSINVLQQFINQSVGNTYNYWNFGDSTQSVSVSPQHIYENSGVYIVQLITVSDDGCRDTTEVPVDIRTTKSYFIPSSFTPDANGLNDCFAPMGAEMPDYTLQIFNRWGQLLFSETGKPQWNGCYKNQLLPLGMYIYSIRIYNPTDPVIEAGTVMLLR